MGGVALKEELRLSCAIVGLSFVRTSTTDAGFSRRVSAGFSLAAGVVVGVVGVVVTLSSFPLNSESAAVLGIQISSRPLEKVVFTFDILFPSTQAGSFKDTLNLAAPLESSLWLPNVEIRVPS